jgi:VWFA-related protein
MTAQSSDQAMAQSSGSQAPFQLKVGSNLVVVRVVVRDANGKPVAGLQKEDFKLLDRGKEQTISQFEVETSSLPSSGPGTVAPPAMSSMKEPPNKFLALYFDTFNTSDKDIIYVREAAYRYLAANIHTRDRVAIFTSEKMLLDFTDDPQKIRAALNDLKTSGRAMLRVHDCPDLSDYQALQIVEQENPENSDAWEIAIDEARAVCRIRLSTGDIADNGKPATGAQQSSSQSPMAILIRSLARNIVFQSQMEARANLQALGRVVDYLGQMPGQRTVVLVSPGFLSQDQQLLTDQLIDRALRSQVIIGSLDPRGLTLPLRADASTEAVPGRPGVADRLDSQRDLVAQQILAEVAEDTGGSFFHSNNDLQAGFTALGGAHVDYVLAFAPGDLKNDGKFHSLKVKLAQKHDGLSVQARRGYFAPKNEADAMADAKRQTQFDAEAQEEEQIRDAMFSKTVSQQLPVGLGGKLSDVQSGTRELSLVSHLDTKPLHFQKEDGHNLNTVNFVFAIFDEKDNLVVARLKRTSLSVSDAQLQDLLKDGITVGTSFQLKPGVYRIREVVTDTQEHHLTAVSTALKVP